MDSGETALNEFAEKLNLHKSNQKDSWAIDTQNQENLNQVIFQTLKIVILKKMWNQSSEENQYSLLISNECEALGLNRFPIHDNKALTTPGKDLKIAYQKTLNACKSENIQDLASYIGKDVLAETLLNIKQIFPESYPALVDSLCKNLSSIDEVIFKNDDYADFASAERSIDSVNDFSKWLKDVFADFNKKETAPVVQNDYASYNLETASQEHQKALEKAYLEKQTPGQPEQEVLVNSYGILYKNSKGKFFYKPTPEQKAASDSWDVQNKANNDKFNMDNSIAMIEEAKKQMGQTYEKGQVAGQPEKATPVPDVPGFFIVKGEDSSYYYKVENQELYLAKIKKFKEKFEQTMDAELLKPEMQKMLKASYEQLIMYNDEDIPENLNITKDEKGVYHYNKNSSMSQNSIGYSNQFNDLLSSGLTIDHGTYPIPSSAGTININGMMLKISDLDSDKPINLFSNIGFGYDASSSTVQSASFNDVNSELLQRITKKYQNRTTDDAKFSNLTKEESADLNDYTGGGYWALNNCLRQDNCNEERVAKIGRIVSALQKIKNDHWASTENQDQNKEQQILFRGASGLPKKVEEELVKSPKGFVLDPGFMSTSGDARVAKRFAGLGQKSPDDPNASESSTLFILKTKSCLGIQSISMVKSEDEFLCPPGMKFDVKKREGKGNVYILEEQN